MLPCPPGYSRYFFVRRKGVNLSRLATIQLERLCAERHPRDTENIKFVRIYPRISLNRARDKMENLLSYSLIDSITSSRTLTDQTERKTANAHDTRTRTHTLSDDPLTALKTTSGAFSHSASSAGRTHDPPYGSGSVPRSVVVAPSESPRRGTGKGPPDWPCLRLCTSTDPH